MEGEASSEFQDWEVLHNSESGLVNSPNSVDNYRDFQGIEGESEGMIRSDYFSLDNQGRYSNTTTVVVDVDVDEEEEEEEASVESDNPSWIDPIPASQTRKNSTEFWSDSGSDRSDERRFSDLDAKNELGFVDNVKSQVGIEGIGEIEANKSEDSVKFSDFDVKNQLGFVDNAKSQVGLEGFGEIHVQDIGEERDNVKTGDGNGSVSDELEGGDGHENVVAIEEMKSGSEEEKRRIIAWWKVPFEVLKYCVFKVSPVWTFSMAAAVMGIFILGRRLYKMKRKTRSLELKVTVDDKKVSQFMSRAARLNEAFSVVRRVPIVRPSLPAAGVNPWPVMSLR